MVPNLIGLGKFEHTERHRGCVAIKKDCVRGNKKVISKPQRDAMEETYLWHPDLRFSTFRTVRRLTPIV